MTATLTQPGDATTRTFGALRVTSRLLANGIAITVQVGCERSSALSRSFPTARIGAARAWYAHLRKAAEVVPVHVIEEELAVIQAAAFAAEQALTEETTR